MKIQAISNFTMKNKLDLISRGFMVYKIRQHIGYLREQLNQRDNKIETTEKEMDINSRLSFLNPNPAPEREVEYLSSNIEPKNQDYDLRYLAQNDLVIGMNGRPIKMYLADIEKKLGKPLSSI
jgi:hypothetical protein